MNKHCIAIISGILIHIFISAGWCQDLQFKILKREPVVPSPSEQFLVIEPEKDTYKSGENIWINVSITNTSKEDITVYGYLQFGAFNTAAKTRHGYSMRDMQEDGYIPDILWIDQILKPSESIKRRIDLTDFNNFPNGEYTATFTFVPWEENEDPLHKTIYLSNVIKIEIK